MFWLFMAALFLAMGGGFLTFGSFDPVEGVTFFVLGVVFLLIGGIFLMVAIWSIRASRRRRHIAQTGIAGTATVTGMSDTNARVNDAPLVKFQFLVSVPGRSPYPVSKHMVLPLFHIGRVAPGVTIPVKVDPNDPDELLLEWDREWDGATAPLMGGAFGVPGSFGGGGFDQAGGFGQASGFGTPGAVPPGWGQAGLPVASIGMPQGLSTMPGTVIDATGGGDPIAMVSSDQLDQATLDRINRALYEREHGITTGAAAGAPSNVWPGAPAAAPASAWPGAPAAGQPPPIDQVLEAIGRGPAATPGALGTAGADRTSAPPPEAAPVLRPPASSGASGTASFGLLDPKQAERLAAVGYTGRATIASYQDTGIASGDDRLHTLQLTVRVDGRPEMQVRHATLVPQRALGRLEAGATLPVRVDPLDGSQLIIEWDKG